MKNDNKTTIDQVVIAMNQQEEILKYLKKLVTICEENNLLDGIDKGQLEHLKKYTADMAIACATANILKNNLLAAYEAEKKKKENKKVVPKPKEQEPAEESAFDFDD